MYKGFASVPGFLGDMSGFGDEWGVLMLVGDVFVMFWWCLVSLNRVRWCV